MAEREALALLMRWIHISSAALLIGGAAYASFLGAANALVSRRARVWVYGTAAALLASGAYAVLSSPQHTGYYHGWLAVKVLLALHVFVSAALALNAAQADKRARRLSSAAISGLVVIAIAAYLRRIF